MKKHGTKFEYEAERNRDLMRVYRQVINRPAERFWVSEERAAIVISSLLKGRKLTSMRKCKRDMFREIFRRAKALLKQDPDLTPKELAFIVVAQPAPKFYITPGSCKIIICSIKKCLRKQKQQHSS